MKLLIADDDATSRTVLNAIARKWGFDPVLAEDGLAARMILEGETPPKLLILDWEMPKIDGLTLCKQIRDQQPNDPPYIILLTGRSGTDDIVAGLEAGANDYISKPFNNAELQARLRVGHRMLDMQSDLLEAQKKLKIQATYDQLTGLLNRGAILDLLQIELQRAQREMSEVYIGLCDVDNFKAINDTYGHLVGDEVLKELSRRVLSTLRPYDHFGRFGGEEFLLIASGKDRFEPDLVERVRKAICETPFVLGKLELEVSMSAGVVNHRCNSEQCHPKDLLRAADEALYEAKENGRNQVVISGWH